MRAARITILCLVVAACSASDKTVGITDGTGSEALKSAGVFSRLDLGTLGGGSSYAADINNDGTVVGWSQTASGAAHAFRWSESSGMLDLGTLPGDESSRALAILDGPGAQGAQILGVSTLGLRSTPVVWSASGAISALTVPVLSGFTIALPTDFNTRGDIVGSDAGSGQQHGWVWSNNGTKYDLSANVSGGSTEGSANAVSQAGLVLLTTRAFTCHHSPDCWRSYLWKSGTGYTPLGTPVNDAEANVTGLALTENGIVVGWLTSQTTWGATAYRWDATSGFTPLAHHSTGDYRYGYAAAVNSAGSVVGGDFDPAVNAIVASTWLPSGAIARLSPGDPNGSLAVSINDVGTVAGWAVAGSANHAVIWKRIAQSYNADIVADPTPKRHVSTASSRCLTERASISSRAALFSCVAGADQAH